MTDQAFSGRPSSAPAWIAAICLVMIAALLFANQFVPQKWEYMIVSPEDAEFTKAMDRLGADGWELVSARRATSGSGGDASYEMILKRPVLVAAPE